MKLNKHERVVEFKLNVAWDEQDRPIPEKCELPIVTNPWTLARFQPTLARVRFRYDTGEPGIEGDTVSLDGRGLTRTDRRRADHREDTTVFHTGTRETWPESVTKIYEEAKRVILRATTY